MNTKQLILHALIDAINWRESLADAEMGSKDGLASKVMAARYRKIMIRRYGIGRTPKEQMFDRGVSVPIEEIGGS